MKCDICGAEMVQPIMKMYCPREDEHEKGDDGTDGDIVMMKSIGVGHWSWSSNGALLSVVSRNVALRAVLNFVEDDGSSGRLGPMSFDNMDEINSWVAKMKIRMDARSVRCLPKKFLLDSQ